MLSAHNSSNRQPENFDAEAASESLEGFLGDLLSSELDLKIIVISTDSDLREEEDEEDTIGLGPIKSTALLFGEISRFITANGCPAFTCFTCPRPH